MTDIQEVMATLLTEGQRAVDAAVKAHAETVSDIRRQIIEAEAARTESRLKVRRMREEAARILAESLKVEEAAEDAFSAAMREIAADMESTKALRVRSVRQIGAAA